MSHGILNLGRCLNILVKKFKQFKYFVTEQIPALKRENMWIQLLEGIPSQEAELLDLVKEGHWPFKHITKNLVEKAFPETTFN